MVFRDQMLALAPKLKIQARALTRGAEEADDLVQETFMRAWQFRHTFQPGTNLKAWMSQILRRAFLASVTRKLKTVSDVDGKFSARLAQDADQEWRLRVSEVLSGLGKLSAEQREALLLIASRELTYGEAALAFGCSTGTIKSRVSRARERLSRTSASI